jgi:hypothetical protein
MGINSGINDAYYIDAKSIFGLSMEDGKTGALIIGALTELSCAVGTFDGGHLNGSIRPTLSCVRAWITTVAVGRTRF